VKQNQPFTGGPANRKLLRTMRLARRQRTAPRRTITVTVTPFARTLPQRLRASASSGGAET
jgi:hypothetical protein